MQKKQALTFKVESAAVTLIMKAQSIEALRQTLKANKKNPWAYTITELDHS